MLRIACLVLVFALAPVARAAEPAPPIAAGAAPAVDFSRDVLPVLSDYCFQCHGPDANTRKAKLRFDDKNSPFDRGVIVPGKPKESALIERVTSTDPELVMPPPSLKRKLSAQQIDALNRWVEQGAKWSTHWAFDPVQKPAVPEVRNPKFEIRNPIDAFVADRLIRDGLAQTPAADKERLLRRVTFDLTGLPPTVAETDAFLKDGAPNAYEKVVDRLLASPRYGERMAGEWLDIARFADTHGYQMDRTRPVWPYRDWVISAYNRNLPFNDFATWQLAGDLLPGATRDQRLATAFNRLHMQNEEGGIVEEEFRVAYVNDRTTTFGTAFLGLTFECSRCHDHKFDPVSQKDYYSLFAFFQNIDESGQTSYFTAATPVPALLLTTDAQDKKLVELRAKITAKEAEYAKLRDAAKPAFEEWLKGKRILIRGAAGAVGSYNMSGIGDGKAANNADGAKPGRTHESPVQSEDSSGQPAVRLNGENGLVFPDVGHFTRSDPFSLSVRLRPPEKHASRAVVVHHSRAPIDAGSRGYELLLEDGRVSFGLHHMWPGNSVKVRTKARLKPATWADVSVTYDGSSRAAGVRVYIDGKAAEVEVVRDRLTKDIAYGGGEPDLTVGFRFRDNGFKDGEIGLFQVFNRELTAVEVAVHRDPGVDNVTGFVQIPGGVDPNDILPKDQSVLFDGFLGLASQPIADWRKEVRALRDEERRLVEPIPEIMVMDEMPTPKPAHVLKRGAYDTPGDKVTADTPKVLPPFPKDAPRNRLGLAKWLTDPENPLLARVTVNRAWQQMFGRGMVETADNFGTQGARPTHPELLDWLAREFVRTGWDQKQLLKTIAMSATYRQSSKAPAELLGRDPHNELLARGPVKRLTAEMLRDQALASSGLLVDKLGGPSVKPYQPAGLWEEIAMGRPRYDQGKGDDLYRRSLYTFWKRTVPPPSLTTFDAADRSVCSVKRQSTSTPLQALVLLNDIQFVESARFVGQRMQKEGGATVEARVSWAFRLVTSRSPTDKERAVLVKLFAEQQAIFEKDPAAAKKLLTVGEKPADPALPVADLAAATVLANVLFSLDESVMRR